MKYFFIFIITCLYSVGILYILDQFKTVSAAPIHPIQFNQMPKELAEIEVEIAQVELEQDELKEQHFKDIYNNLKIANGAIPEKKLLDAKFNYEMATLDCKSSRVKIKLVKAMAKFAKD